MAGLLALMLLHHARRAARRTRPTARSSRWPSRTARCGTPALIAEGVAVLQAALARDRLGEYQAQAAIAALHADARSVDETDWVQIVEWYDELLARHRQPGRPAQPRRRGRRGGRRRGPGWRRSTQVDSGGAAVPGGRGVPARAGRRPRAARPGCTREAARAAGNVAERDHLTRQAARLNALIKAEL